VFDWSYCTIHHECETIPRPVGAYRVCGACGHVYATPADLVDAFNREQSTGGIAAPHIGARHVHRVGECQECGHGFD
jgi:hypothetical protein